MNDCVYTIDHQNRIVRVGGNWLAFAAANQGGKRCHPDRVLNQPLWNFIAGDETQYLYSLCLAKVRLHQQTIVLPFRCDAPDRRRYLELTITPLSHEQIEFTSRILREEPRREVDLLRCDAPRSEELIKMCSMCKKVRIPEDGWLDVEVAIAALHLFDLTILPQITHGVCPPCHAIALEEIRRLNGAADPQKSEDPK